MAKGRAKVHSITIPETDFTCPKFTFGQVVIHPASGVWGCIIGMNYISPDMNPNWLPGWKYEIRLDPRSCSEHHFFLMSGTDVFNEHELHLKDE